MRRNAEPEPIFGDWPEEFSLESGRVAFDGTNLAFHGTDGEGQDHDIYLQPLDGSTGMRP